jgi:hypothetical protein
MKSAEAASIRRKRRVASRPRIPGSRRLQLPRAARIFFRFDRTTCAVIFDDFGLQSAKLRVWRLPAVLQKSATGGLLCDQAS